MKQEVVLQWSILELHEKFSVSECISSGDPYLKYSVPCLQSQMHALYYQCSVESGSEMFMHKKQHGGEGQASHVWCQLNTAAGIALQATGKWPQIKVYVLETSHVHFEIHC